MKSITVRGWRRAVRIIIYGFADLIRRCSRVSGRPCCSSLKKTSPRLLQRDRGCNLFLVRGTAKGATYGEADRLRRIEIYSGIASCETVSNGNSSFKDLAQLTPRRIKNIRQILYPVARRQYRPGNYIFSTVMSNDRSHLTKLPSKRGAGRFGKSGIGWHVDRGGGVGCRV